MINLCFQPFYGGKLHRVSAEVKNGATGNIVCKVQGEWNSLLEFTYANVRPFNLVAFAFLNKKMYGLYSI